MCPKCGDTDTMGIFCCRCNDGESTYLDMSGYWSDSIENLHELELEHRQREDDDDSNRYSSEGTDEKMEDDMWVDTHNQVVFVLTPETTPSSPHTHTEIDLTGKPEGGRGKDGGGGRRRGWRREGGIVGDAAGGPSTTSFGE